MQEKQAEILTQLDAIDNALDNLVSVDDIALATRLQTTVKNFKNKLPKLSRAGFDVSSLDTTLSNIDERLSKFLREYN